jgi:hypothetical protein
MSSLQTQLAALNGSSGKNPGLVYATSKRHEDAVGRGANYSVQHGHHVTNRVAYKPSIIQASAKEASDIPLHVLEENCKAAMENLADTVDPRMMDLLPSICGRQNASPKIIQDALLRVGSLLGEFNAIESCLHVLEYLIRRYDVHTKHMEDFLWVLLPHADHWTAVFHRALQLCDLASNQSYIWLRPYANPKVLAVVPRALIAQHVVKHPDLIRTVGRLAKQQAALAATSITQESLISARRGISHILSFTVAVLVEGLAWQTAADRLPAQQEASLRAMLPFCLAACESQTGCLEWTAWGHVLASVLAETMDLAPVSVEAISKSILSAPETFQQQADALTALLAVLLPLQQQQMENSDSYLPLLTNKLLGCDLPRSCLRTLRKWPQLPTVLGHLHEDCRTIVAPLIATLFVLGLEENNVQWLVRILEEKSLRSLWKNPRTDIVASTAAFCLEQHIKSHRDRRASMSQSLLENLHRLDTLACERGIAHAIQSIPQQKSQETRELVRDLLKGIVSIDESDNENSNVNLSTEHDRLLPPRVALEHADASIRLLAVQRLIPLLDQRDQDNDGESIWESLVRRWSVDEHPEVAEEAGKAVTSVFKNRMLDEFATDLTEIAKLTLSGLHHWIDSNREQVECLRQGFVVSAYIARNMAESTIDSPSKEWQLIMETLAAYSNSTNKTLATVASKALLFVLGDSQSFIKNDAEIHVAQMKLAESRIFVQGLHTFQDEPELDNSITRRLRRLSLWVLVESYSRRLADSKVSSTLVHDALQVCSTILNAKEQGDMTDKKVEILKDCYVSAVHVSSKTICTVHAMILSLAAVNSDALYTGIGLPTITSLVQNVTNSEGEAVLSSIILMESALQLQDPLSCCRLVELTCDILSSGNEQCWLIVVGALALLDSPHKRIRKASIGLLSTIATQLSTLDTPPTWNQVRSFCRFIAESHSSAVMGGVSFLPSMFKASMAAEKQASSLQKALLRLCVFATVGYSGDGNLTSPKALQKSWMYHTKLPGGCAAASTVLNAMEKAGETVFPLCTRWEIAGLPLFKQLHTAKVVGVIPLSVVSLAECIVKMMKGMVVTDTTSIIISSGPHQGGGRSRSYSVGKSDVEFVEQYPKAMQTELVAVLSDVEPSDMGRLLSALVVDDVLSSISWGEEIFKRFSKGERKKLAKAILFYSQSEHSQLSHSQFVALPFDGEDLLSLLSDLKITPGDMSSLVLLADFVRVNCARLNSAQSAGQLISLFFGLLKLLVLETEVNMTGSAVAAQSLLSTLSQLWTGIRADQLDLDANTVIGWATTLLQLLDELNTENTSSPSRFVSSTRARSAALFTLTTMCNSFPKECVVVVFQTITKAASAAGSGAIEISTGGDIFAATLPVFWKFANHADLSLVDILSGFVRETQRMDVKKVKSCLFGEFAKALLVGNHVRRDFQQSCPGSLVASFLAAEVFTSRNLARSPDFAVEVIEQVPIEAQIWSVLLLLKYAKSTLLLCMGSDATDDDSPGIPNNSHIAKIALVGPKTRQNTGVKPDEYTKNSAKLVSLVGVILRTVNDVLLLESTSKFVRQCRDKSSSLCLRLWQELLIMHSVAQSAAADEKLKGLMNTMENLVLTVNESREYLQLLLPAHIFLASVTALLKEGDSIDIRTKALRLVAERVPDVDPYGEEVPLFMEMVPDIVDVLRSTDGSNGSEESSKILLLRQSALVAVEHIARCFSVGGGITASNTQHFLSALGRATDLLQFPCQVLAQPNASLSHIDNAARQIISSVALSSATLVRTTGPLCISTLPKLIKRLMSALTSANSYVLLNGNTSDDNETFAQAKVMQASILRALSAIAFSVPQFLPSYLHLVLNESNILSPSLRQDRDSVMKSTIERLDQLLSARIPPRLMIPAIVKATGQCKNATTVAVLLKMLKISVEQCTGAEAVAQRNAVLKVVTQAYENQSSLESGALLVHTANDALMTFILKLSEVHLRRLYLSLRDWRGVVDKLAPESSSAHRFAFWTLSAALAKGLRSIFLPCLSVSIGDAVSELELAASSLCQSGNAVKKRKLNDERTESSYDSVSMQVVQPVLLCLEHALRADGLDGGSWIRADENQRYHALLEPMGKLLQARIPGNFLKENDHLSSPFARVIVGEYSDLGNVVSCLSALANAAGNEQLWKPLNYYVLEACGNESRGEVRKAGLTCLVSLMKSLGEEYMVLLPECLPILSELLEDTDEEIAGLAKECVTLAEDLLGTSLEDSLR